MSLKWFSIPCCPQLTSGYFKTALIQQIYVLVDVSKNVSAPNSQDVFLSQNTIIFDVSNGTFHSLPGPSLCHSGKATSSCGQGLKHLKRVEGGSVLNEEKQPNKFCWDVLLIFLGAREGIFAGKKQDYKTLRL